MHSIWFWVKDPSGVDRDVAFSVARDNVYLAIVLLGMGGATVLVLAYTMISQVVGKFTVSKNYIYVQHIYQGVGLTCSLGSCGSLIYYSCVVLVEYMHQSVHMVHCMDHSFTAV